MDEKRPDIPAPEQPDKGPVQPESRDLDCPVQPAKPRPPQPVEPHSVETGRPPQPQQPAEPLQSGGPQQPAQPNQPAVPSQPGEPHQPQQPAQPQSPMGAQQPNGQQPYAPQMPYDQQPPQFPMGYGGQGAYPPPAPPAYVQGGGGKAIGALVCGIFAILLSFLPLFGLVLGIIAIVLASKAVKRSGRDGKATAGKVCGIIGIVLAVLSFIFWGVASCAVIALSELDADGNTYGNTYGTVFESEESSASDGELLTAEEEAAQAVAVVELDKLANQDEATVQSLAAELDEGFAEAMGLGHADLGVDPVDLARWMLTDFTYEPDGVYVVSDDGGLKATMYADVELRDSYAFMMNFYDKVDAFQQSDEIETMTEAEAKARIGELYREAMDETTDMTTWYTAIELEKQGEQWVVDQDAWGDELEGMFGIY